MRSILIVAKDSAPRAALEARLDRAGYLVFTADSPALALESLSGLLPGAILIDLPVAAARRMVRALRIRPDVQYIPRLLVLPSFRAAGNDLPVAATFWRPVEPEHLMRSLEWLYPRRLAGAPPQPAVSAQQRDERILEAIELIAAETAAEAPLAASSAVQIAVPAPMGSASALALAVANSYLVELAASP